MKVIKRDGREVSFDKDKIRAAVEKAFVEVDKELDDFGLNKAKEIANYVESLATDMNVEEIQDIVENKLMASSRKDVAKAYILYRDKRNRVRQWNSKLMKDVSEKLKASNVQNQNANIDEYSFGGRKGEVDAAIMKQYALDNCMSEMAKNNHLTNQIYIHDLDSYAVGMHNCLSIPFDKLLANGFNTRQSDIRPAGSVSTAFQLVAVLFQLQSLQQFGGVSATHLDWTMVPYVRKSFYKHFVDGLHYIEDPIGDEYLSHINNELSIEDERYKKPYSYAYNYAMDMTIRETEQAAEGMYHNLNN